MKNWIMSIVVASAALALPASAQEVAPEEPPRWSIAIHGGAGTIRREDMSEEREAEYRAALQAALDAGSKVLAEGGSAQDAVIAAIVIMEDDARFNAGRGAVLTWDGVAELDAAIMTGEQREAGAVTGVRTVRNPILLAREVKDNSPHVFLSGSGAESFAADRALEFADPSYFITEPRVRALEGVKARELSVLQAGDNKFGTVGAVALDSAGNMAAGTSTGGLTGKRWGRIGDAPVVGAGTYADNRSCAVSATGTGEYFIRVAVAHEICTRLRIEGAAYREREREAVGATGADAYVSNIFRVQRAIVDEVMAEMAALGGTGGVIVALPDGATFFSFDTPGMYRGRANSFGLNEVALYADEGN
ncbi:isoaspartyl peptidase/L-asparaginase [Alteriqipengyuania sp. WL0013]|uniref:isoaspartyl peptidase/L-asparaginase family protein n=1 Tax=Alteriqipengyuania sp. WL0013 TaxID=3110773 RepID=UPI002CE123D4|nr:isoaspartyl peptidase/L-asparaginase [Alteriqipengyuania sp. WL0013]MEB3416664.1 isoaspartyl peptidase/L-asparaginase [Alteriqipengyuania sp. WL0013]